MSAPMMPYGQYQPPVPTAPPKSPGVAAILSLLLPGAGHLYTGNPVAAALWFSAYAVSWLLCFIVIGFVTLPAAWIGSMIHAYMSADDFNRRHHAIR
jgi:TM2 domain-containing membrane protein YozV